MAGEKADGYYASVPKAENSVWTIAICPVQSSGKICERRNRRIPVLFILCIMMVIISYDVCTEDKEGKKRLRKVAKECENHAQRVQNSVFEVDLDYGKFLKLKDSLLKIIDDKKDSLRFYYLGNNWKKRVEHFGAKETYNPEGVIII